MEWPPDYAGELDRRLKLEHRLTADRELLAGALLVYADNPAAFIGDCVYIYEPRNANTGEPVMLPVVLFPRQRLVFSSITATMRVASSSAARAHAAIRARPC
jgi:hypothetical protein